MYYMTAPYSYSYYMGGSANRPVRCAYDSLGSRLGIAPAGATLSSGLLVAADVATCVLLSVGRRSDDRLVVSARHEQHKHCSSNRYRSTPSQRRRASARLQAHLLSAQAPRTGVGGAKGSRPRLREGGVRRG